MENKNSVTRAPYSIFDTPIGQSYVKCREKIISQISNEDERINKSMLRYKNWSMEDYKAIRTWRSEVLRQTSPYEVIDVIFIRYMSLLTRLSFLGNDIGKNILHQIVMNKISDQISYIGKINAMHDDRIIKEINAMHHRITTKIDVVHKICYNSEFLDNDLVKTEFKNVELITLHVLNPAKELINNQIQTLKQLKEITEEKTKEYPQYENDVKKIKNIISLFEEATQVGK
jgi:hypothetical protein